MNKDRMMTFMARCPTCSSRYSIFIGAEDAYTVYASSEPIKWNIETCKWGNEVKESLGNEVLNKSGGRLEQAREGQQEHTKTLLSQTKLSRLASGHPTTHRNQVVGLDGLKKVLGGRKCVFERSRSGGFMI